MSTRICFFANLSEHGIYSRVAINRFELLASLFVRLEHMEHLGFNLTWLP